MFVNIPYMDPMGDVMSVRNDANFSQTHSICWWLLFVHFDSNLGKLSEVSGGEKNFGL